MDNQARIEASVAYIAEHLEQPLTLEQLAGLAGYSPYYFSRLFSQHIGMSVMEYIRHRRLAQAATDLCAGKRVLDVAMDYGFESHNGFAKAFRKVYGYSPDEYRSRVSPHRPIAPNPLSEQGIADTLLPEVRVEERAAFYVAGMAALESASVYSISQQPALWNSMWMAEMEHKIYAMARPREHGEYYISFPQGNGLYRLLTCVKVDEPESADKRLCVERVPAGLYAVFSTPPTRDNFSQTVMDTWRYIFGTWLPQSGYEPAEQGIDYEFYDERCHGAPFAMDICVQVKQREEN